MRRIFVLVSCFAVLLSFSTDIEAKGKIRLIHDNTSHAVIPYIAEQKGFYKAEGLDVQRRVTSPRAEWECRGC